ncbi:MAG: CehA/McbA family metallohydrolase [Ignavibacteriales bacterium]|nr:CehA/McbA family metallohydrolase [Ignavibacteriales bacterium]
MSFPIEFVLGLPFLLYAETHYRFRYFFSLLRKSEPELIADVPHRIEPKKQLPILVIAKDSDRYPCILKQVEVTIRHEKTIIARQTLLQAPVELRDPMWWQVWKLSRPSGNGLVQCDVAMTIEQEGISKVYHNDNHISSSRRAFRVLLSEDALPRFPRLYFGDAHTHSDYTNDQVEFGSPLDASKELSKALGLSFFCVTDHSYDLDDRIDDYLENDNSLPKWNGLRLAVQKTNKQNPGFVIVSGEEISCRNSRGQNVHLLLFGNSAFFRGTGDGGEKWLRTKSEYSIADVLRQKETRAVAFAAHAREDVPFLQKVLLRRGSWREDDLTNDGLAGLQFANGHMNDGFAAGYHEWKKLLLKGNRLLTIAGNDAHGNFNRFRQIGFPFFKIVERDNQLFGQMRTALFVERPFSERNVLKALGCGSFVITDGPVVNLRKKGSAGATSIGQNLTGAQIDFQLSALSSKEFGQIEKLEVFGGRRGMLQEELMLSHSGLGLKHISTIATAANEPGYIRAELFTSASTSADGKSHFCYTNPIWLGR